MNNTENRTDSLCPTSLDVTEEKIAALRAEAGAAGDLEMVRHCDLATTNVDSFRHVLEAMRDAAAQA